MPKRCHEIRDEQFSPNSKRIAAVTLDHAAYTIGWICALPKEQTAAIAMLDQMHTGRLSLVNDDNAYTLGSIAGHNVVIVCLPKGRCGNNSAATIATKMTGSFPAIKFVLLVGIGGGIPSKVRLGDVVVSTPTDQYPGVVQLDYGKAESDGRFRRTGALNSPLSALLKVLAKLESEHEMQEPKIPRFLDEMRQKWPRLYPKYFWNDSLKDAQGGSEVDTSAVFTKCPGIHHGLIASGNRVVKDATFRDRLDEHLNGNLLCLEMEAAGLMNEFPCLVVRGICDYADSTKNDDWQEYAAAVAAAYAKEIISELQICAVEHMDSIKAVDYTLQQKDNFVKRQPGTGQWLLSSDTYRAWVDTSQQTLFCPGIPGAGKTLLTSIVINDLFEKFNKDATVGIAHIYFNFRRHDEQNLLDSCLPQSCPSLDDTKRLLQKITASYSRGANGCRAGFLAEIFLLQESAKACSSMEIRATQEDVQRYVRGQLEGGSIEHLPSLVKNKPELQDAIVRGISDAVDGMFLLAKIFLDSLVDKLTIADVREAIAQLPTHMSGAQEDQRLKILDQAYDSAWTRINQQKEGFRNIATRVLAWIACAKRPLSTKELQHALAVKVGDDELDEEAIPQVHDMVSFCAGLVTVDEESNVIRLVHYTTQEYFERKKSDWFPAAEAMIAETCISYLLLKPFGKYYLDDAGLRYLRSHAFYEYASQYWGDHARIVGRRCDKMILELLKSDAKASNVFYVAQKRFPSR
ncbi:nucleoside phosphorylase domain-containing protein [Trichoderma austrokoningii]